MTVLWSLDGPVILSVTCHEAAKPSMDKRGKHTSEQLRRAYTRFRRGIDAESLEESSMRAAFTIHGASRQKIHFWNFWPFILAHCEAAEPSICAEDNLLVKCTWLNRFRDATYRRKIHPRQSSRQVVQS